MCFEIVWKGDKTGNGNIAYVTDLRGGRCMYVGSSGCKNCVHHSCHAMAPVTVTRYYMTVHFEWWSGCHARC